MLPRTKRKNCSAISTAGEILPDSVALELLRDPSDPKQFRVLSWRGKILEEGPQISRGGRRYEPVRIHPSLAAALRFPKHVAPHESTKQLFTDVHDFLRRHLAQLDSCITAMVFAIFASWISPVLPMAPILSIFAPAGSPKNLALQLLALLCRRPLRLAGLKRGDLLRVPMSLEPTLLLDEPDLQPAMQSILQAGAHRGSYVSSGDRMQDLFGPKIICSSKQLLGTELEAEVLRVALIPASGQVPVLDKKAQEEVAEEFQARFLGYFLRNFSRVQIPNFDVSDLALPIQDLARAFGAGVVGDEDLQAKILPLLKVKDEEIRSDRASAFDSVVVEASLFFIHQEGWSKVRAQSAAEKVEAIYKGRGSDQKVSPESVGWAWKRLGIPSGRINKAGNGVELTVQVCRLVHRLAFSYGVRAVQSGFRSGCRYCDELESESGQGSANPEDHVA
jgi:hypothetical protein